MSRANKKDGREMFDAEKTVLATKRKLKEGRNHKKGGSNKLGWN